ncbi:MAG: tetratricopeptide repeat protein, partial [Opitutales bacterium]
RHPTRYPELYWKAALKRDPMDVRSNIALGRQELARGRFAAASEHFDAAIRRLTFRHPNPETGEAHYYLGLTKRYQGELDAAYPLFYKATWNYAWRAAAYYELACIDLRRGDAAAALQHAEESLETNLSNNKALVLEAICLRRLGFSNEAKTVLENLLEVSPLDHWALAEKSKIESGAAALASSSRNDAQTALDVAFDYADCGCFEESIELLLAHLDTDVAAVSVPNPLERSVVTKYVIAWLHGQKNDPDAAASVLLEACQQSADYCFPSRLHEMIVLEWVAAMKGKERNANYGLGNFYYDKKRYADAINAWEAARDADDSYATVHRNLGIAYWNTNRDGKAARASYQKALSSASDDARLIAEYVQLCGKLGDSAQERLHFLESRRELVLQRDDATVELATLYNETGQHQRALDLLHSRPFHPWEGGEGKVLRQYTTAKLSLGKAALEANDADTALTHFNEAMDTPDSLGEKYHLLQAKADVLYWQGRSLRILGREVEAAEKFEAAAAESGDFQGMAVTEFSELTVFKILALRELGRANEAEAVLVAMQAYIDAEMEVPAKIDYFATSLPNLLVFEEDLDAAKQQSLKQLKELLCFQ